MEQGRVLHRMGKDPNVISDVKLVLTPALPQTCGSWICTCELNTALSTNSQGIQVATTTKWNFPKWKLGGKNNII